MARTIIADIDSDLFAALDARAGLLTLHAILLRYKASGVTAEQVESLLQELRGATQDEALEDVILDPRHGDRLVRAAVESVGLKTTIAA